MRFRQFVAALLVLVSLVASWRPVEGRAYAGFSRVPGLTGTWQVTRTCSAGCSGTTVTREMVRPRSPHVFVATGAKSFLLFRVDGRTVLLYGEKSSAILTIRKIGELMSGPGVGKDGSTFVTSWRCISAAVTAEGYYSHAAKSYEEPHRLGRAIC